VPLSQRIAHLPALVAAGAAWVLGMAWHSEYMFRSQWAKAVGFTDQQAHDLARTWMPHLLTVGACLLFSYGTAMLLMRLGKRSLWTGVEMSVAMWVVIVAVLVVVNPVKTTPDFRWIEGGYTILAALLIGAIVGGVPRRVFLRDTE
jgi:peptidoglycan/LPS O-acetylase OafA/YrhL